MSNIVNSATRFSFSSSGVCSLIIRSMFRALFGLIILVKIYSYFFVKK